MATETDRLLILMQFEADQAEKKAKQMENQVLALERRFDPLGRATQKYERGLKSLERALEAGLIDQKRYAEGVRNLEAELDRAGGAMGRAAQTGGGLSGVMAKNRNVFQQVGYQVGDFAVQVQGGTSAITAFTQQGSQLLGVFGAYGAIAGAALAIGAPLIASFMNSGDAAKTFEDALTDLQEALDAYKAAADIAGMSTDELVEKYGEGAEALRASLGVLRDLAQLQALQDAQAAAEELFLEVVRGVNSLSTVGLFWSNVSNEIYQAGQEMGITKDQVVQLRRAILDFRKAEGVEDIAEKARALNNAFLDVYGSVSEIPTELQSIVAKISQLDVETTDLKGTIDETKFSLIDVVDAAYAAAKGFDIATVSADSLLGRIRDAAKAAWNMAAALAQADAERRAMQPEGGRGADPRLFGGSLQDWNDPENVLIINPGASSTTTTSSSRSGSRGSSSSSASSIDYMREITQLQRRLELLGKTTSEVAELEAKWKLLDEAKRAGIPVDEAVASKIEQTASEVGRLTEELEKARISQEEFEQGMRSLADGMAAAIVKGESLGDVLKNLAAQMLQKGISNLIFGSLSKGLSGTGVGKIFAGFFDSGGSIPAGQVGIAGERGPEIIRGPAQVVSRTQTAKMMQSGGGGEVHVKVAVDGEGSIVPVVTKVAGSVAVATSQASAYQQRRGLPDTINQVTDRGV